MATGRDQKGPSGAVAMIFGVGGALLGFAAASVMLIFISFNCGGSDVSEPSDSPLCTDPIPDIVGVGGFVAAPGASLFGMIVALNRRRSGPLFVGCGASAAILFVMALFMTLTE